MIAPGRARLGWAGLAIAAALAAAAWLASRIEWQDVLIPRALTGKAAEDDQYALVAVLRSIGAHVERREALDELPPTGAVLLLQSWSWHTFPRQDQALRDWVAHGGRLVAGSWAMALEAEPGAPHPWIDVRFGTSRKMPAPSNGQVPGALVPAPLCAPVSEPVGMAPYFAAGDGSGPLQMCRLFGFWKARLVADSALWALADTDGWVIARVPAGSGSVTVVPDLTLFDNAAVLLGDNALIAVAALQAHPGRDVWLVQGRNTAGFLNWLWSRAAAAVVLGALALSLCLWRGAVRFGPLAAAPPATRRSMVEQIVGTAMYLWRRSPATLHTAQMRALDEAAAARIREYRGMDRADRAGAIARLAQTDAAALLRAWNVDPGAARYAVCAQIAVLESARRSLVRSTQRSLRQDRTGET